MIWGFSCCHSTTKQSYCTGKAGIEANNDQLNATGTRALGTSHGGEDKSSSGQTKSLIQQIEENIKRKAAEAAAAPDGDAKGKKRAAEVELGREERERERDGKKRVGARADVGQLDRDKLNKAIQEEKRRKKMEGNEELSYSAQDAGDLEITEEQLEVRLFFSSLSCLLVSIWDPISPSPLHITSSIAPPPSPHRHIG
jgi:pre-mRNA-processing factor SLU7